MLIKVTNFSGEIPQVDAKQLPDNAASMAINARLAGGKLSAYKSLLDIGATTKAGAKKTIYRFGQNETADENYWFVWDQDVDVVRGQINADESERTFFTGPGSISGKTNYTLGITGGTNYPNQQLPIGVPAPTSSLITVAGTPPVSQAVTDATAASETASTAAATAKAALDSATAAEAAAIVTSNTELTALQWPATPASNTPTGEVSDKIYTSADGVSWTARNIGSASWVDVAHNGSIFVAVANNSTDTCASSSDGITWTTRTLNGSAMIWNSVTWTGTYFVAMGISAQRKSADGITWSDVTTPPQGNHHILAAKTTATALSVAISCAGTDTYTSPNGDVWTLHQDVLPSARWVSLVYDGTKFIAYAPKTSLSDPTPACYTSTDGINWTSISTVIAADSPKFVKIGIVGSSIYSVLRDTTRVMRSTDSCATASSMALTDAPKALASIYTGSMYVAVKNEYDAIVAVKAEYDAPTNKATAQTAYNTAQSTADIAAQAATAAVAADAATPLETRYYVYTYVTSWGEESAPSPASIEVQVRQGQSVTVSGFELPISTTADISNIRLYRTQTGSNATDWQFVTEKAANSYAVAYLDETRPEDLGEVIPSLDWDAPSDRLRGLVNLTNGNMAGYVVDVDGNPTSDVMFCEPYRPFTFPQKYSLTMNAPMVGIGAIGAIAVAITKGFPEIISGIDPASMSSQKVELQQSGVSKRSIVSMGGAVLYACPDGLASISMSGADVVTRAHFSEREWRALNPSTITGCQYDGRYFAFFEAGGGFIFDPAGIYIRHDIDATAAFNDLRHDALYLAVGGDIVKWDSGASYLAYTWRSKSFEVPLPTNFAWGQCFCEGDVTMNVYADGSLKITKAVENGVPFRLPSGFKARLWQIEFTGTGTVTSGMIAHTMQELQSV